MKEWLSRMPLWPRRWRAWQEGLIYASAEASIDDTLTMAPALRTSIAGSAARLNRNDRCHLHFYLRLREIRIEFNERHVRLKARIVDEHRQIAGGRTLFDRR